MEIKVANAITCTRAVQIKKYLEYFKTLGNFIPYTSTRKRNVRMSIRYENLSKCVS